MSEINPLPEEGIWYETDNELLEALSVELTNLEKRREYIQGLIDEIVNRG